MPKPTIKPVRVRKPVLALAADKPSVAENGECPPGMETFNRDKFGYASPREHFIEGPGDLSDYSLCVLWRVKQHTLAIWKSRGKWVEKRAERLKAVGIVPATKEVEERLAAEIMAWKEQKMGLHQAILAKAMKLMDECEETMTPTGEIKEIKLRIKSLKDLSNVVVEQSGCINSTLGVPTKIRPEREEKPEVEQEEHRYGPLMAVHITSEAPRQGRMIDALPMCEDD